MARYELIEGTSKKFWEITLEGTSFTTTYGRIGTDGQSSMKEYDSEEKARKEHDKLIAEKTKKGYALVSGGGSAAPAPAKAPAAKAAAKPKAAVFDDEGEDEDEDDEEEAPKPKKPVAAKPAAAKPAAAKPAAAKPAAAKPAAASGASKSGASGARYFEFVDGSSSKFWEITLEGTSFTTRYGKIGTEGQISMKEYDSEERTQREYDKLVAEKTKKGYVEK